MFGPGCERQEPAGPFVDVRSVRWGRSAVIYTLLGSCRRHGINPFEYLKDLFMRLPAAKITEIRQFTPPYFIIQHQKLDMVRQPDTKKRLILICGSPVFATSPDGVGNN